MKRRDFLTGTLAASGLAMGLSSKGFAASLAGGGAASVESALEAVSAIVEEQMELLGIPGVAVGVIKNGTTHLLPFGITSIEDPQPVTEDTTFEIASLSKTVTATAVMHLVDAGLLDLDAPVREYIPDWTVADAAASEEMLVRHLITHTTGLNGPASTRSLGDATLEDFAASMDRLVSVAPPGAQWSYLNPGYALAGRLVEIATGSNIHSAFEDIIFTPLGLDRTTTRIEQLATFRMTLGHRPVDGGGVEIVRPYSMGSSIPAGGVNMSIENVMRYIAFHMGQGGDDVLSLATRQRMREPQVIKMPTEDAMTLGWHYRMVGGVETFAHGGSAGAGHRLVLEMVPERDLAFAVFTNHTEGWRLAQVVEHAILREFEGLALEPNQLITYRGANEDFTLHATPLETQPDPAEYVGTYTRGESDPIEIRAEDGALFAGNTPLYFHGPDVSYSGSNGTPTEFIRDESGAVTWIRQNGQGFAVKS